MTVASSLPSTLRWHQAGGRLHLGKPDRPVASLPLDAASIAQGFFHHDPPRPVELERAIDVIEDALMAIAPQVGSPDRFVSDDPVLLRLPGARAGTTLDAAQVEALFQRLASASLGHPSAAAGLPAGREAAATLLLLRETMHHLGVGVLQLEGR